MAVRLFGAETEYALTALDRRGASVEREPLLGELLELAKETLPHLPDRATAGLYLQNGARFYVDCGNHPELSTPECSHPEELVRYIRAGDQLLWQLAGRLKARRRRLKDVIVLRSNVDYSSMTTWGSHESYLHRAEPTDLPRHLIPHLVSRIVYTGAGGFNSMRPHALDFTLSPRVWHLTGAISAGSTSVRGIFHCKDESLSAAGYHRLHVLCGESLCSDLGTYLKFGATALVVALVEAGVQPGEMVQLHDPLDAMRQFAADPTCRVAVKTENGARITALAIQRHYLALARRHIGHEQMPAWADEVCDRWNTILDRLEAAPESLATTLDWAIKLKLYRAHAAKHGIAWESLARMSHVEPPLQPALPGLGGDLLRSFSEISAQSEAMDPPVAASGLDPEELRGFHRLREELFEIDTRFAQLGDAGIFTVLSRAGAVSHQTAAPAAIERAMKEPPLVGRARLRGAQVRQLHGNGDRYACDWKGVWDSHGRRRLDLLDPFATRAGWGQWVEPDDGWFAAAGRVDALHRQGIARYHQYRYAESLRFFRRASATAVHRGEHRLQGESAFWQATVLHNLGRLREAAAVLDRLAQEPVAADVIYGAMTRRALIAVEIPRPLAEIEELLRVASDRLAALHVGDWRSRLLLVQARLLEARGMYDRAFEVAVEGLERSRRESRAIAVDTHRRTVLTAGLSSGRWREIESYLEEWMTESKPVMLLCGRSVLARVRGLADDALRTSEQAGRLAESRADRTVRGLFYETRIRALLCAGDLQEARGLLDSLSGERKAEAGAVRYGAWLLWADYQLCAARQLANLPGIDPATDVQLDRVCRDRVDRLAPAHRLSLAHRSYERARQEGQRLDVPLECNAREREIAARFALVDRTRREIGASRGLRESLAS